MKIETQELSGGKVVYREGKEPYIVFVTQEDKYGRRTYGWGNVKTEADYEIFHSIEEAEGDAIVRGR